MKLIDPVTGQAVWDSNDPNAGPVPPAPEGRQWVRVDEPGDTMAPRLRAPGILDIGNGVTERLAFLNQTFNPVEGIGSAMQAGSRMVAPDQSYWDRIASLGEMASGVASIAAPMAAAKAIGVPAASAMMEGLLGASPTSQAATDMARGFTADESGALRLYHGSPHDFDRFSMSKIGTGEGAQAYGHGLYFAENEGVARGYRDALTDGPTHVSIYGERFSPDELHGIEADAARAVLKYDEPSGWRDYLSRFYDDEQVSEAMGLLESGVIKAAPPGHMYEVNIHANPEDFLDWDKPLSAQAPAIRDAFLSLGTPDRLASVQGENAYRALSNNLGALDWPVGADAATRRQFYAQGAANASDALREAGIPGIRYLDAGSRGAGDGSRNYVIFDENLINIVRKYGVAGAAAMLGVSAFDVEQALAENLPPSQWDQLVVGPQ